MNKALLISATCILAVFSAACGDRETDAPDGATDAGIDGGQHHNPLNLKPMTMADAKRAAAQARKMLVQPAGKDPVPMAWSQINMECNVRMEAEQFALASAPEDGSAVVMRQADITGTLLDKLIASPAYDSGGITITGPIATWQGLARPDGSLMSGIRMFWYWSYHFSTVVNVDGEYMVMDMSVGDTPVPVDEWISGIMEPSVKCVRADKLEDYQKLWDYWITVWGSMFEPPFPPRPDPACAYMFIPKFTSRSDVPPDPALMAQVPVTMAGQTTIFLNSLEREFKVPDVTQSMAPTTLTRYEFATEDDVCGLVHLNYCPYR